jgi:hypothetical protein
MALAIGEAEHFDAREAVQRPGKAGGGILAAGKQHQRRLGIVLMGHGTGFTTPGSHGQSVDSAVIPARFSGIGGADLA